jgi:hypothetical protein
MNESKPEAAPHKIDSAEPVSTQAPPTDTWPSNYSTTGTAPGDGAAEAKTSVESYSTSNESVGKENATEMGEKKPTSWISRLLSPWESEGNKSNPLATAWDHNSAGKTESAPPPPQQTEEPKAAEYPESEHVSNDPVADEQVTDAHYAENQNNFSAQLHQPSPSVEGKSSEEIPSLATASPSITSAETYVANANGTNDPEMDAVVANVLSKLSPEVLQAVTREILKPVIAAMVAEEMKSKK